MPRRCGKSCLYDSPTHVLHKAKSESGQGRTTHVKCMRKMPQFRTLPLGEGAKLNLSKKKCSFCEGEYKQGSTTTKHSPPACICRTLSFAVNHRESLQQVQTAPIEKTLRRLTKCDGFSWFAIFFGHFRSPPR